MPHFRRILIGRILSGKWIRTWGIHGIDNSQRLVRVLRMAMREISAAPLPIRGPSVWPIIEAMDVSLSGAIFRRSGIGREITPKMGLSLSAITDQAEGGVIPHRLVRISRKT